ncbi:hypothetical protein CUZ56_01235 [Saezia sanguinis]|uniref:Uncharacterized protein n=1 Tax=Saezia sanguinis TaxID=1965230 RepID=A0A433SEW8_9BURK|nr:hypothetical protein CUZ56_01235 [Saezia sanguinis]
MLFVCVRTAGHKKRLAPERCSKRYEYFNGLQIQGVVWVKKSEKTMLLSGVFAFIFCN